MNRKSFIHKVGIGTAVALISNNLNSQPKVQQETPPLPIQMVKDFVIAGHGNLLKVKSMMQENPNLIFCKYDWGNGDFEAAIEGAGHVGNKEIANYLLEEGSRVTIYILTMLGKTELVKPILETYPSLIKAKGPHGFTLLHHAKVGGKDAEELYSYLQQKGLNEDKFKLK